MGTVCPTTISPERVRAETPLAPVLLQTEGLITDLLGQLLQMTVVSRTLELGVERHGAFRRSLVCGDGTPLYLAVTYITEGSWTRPLLRALKHDPPPLFGEVLKQHGLFGRRTVPEARRSPYLPEYRELFRADGHITHVWERTAHIFSAQGNRIAGITEIFSPTLEELVRQRG